MSQDPLHELFASDSTQSTAHHVLIVDDDEGVREFLAFELGQEFEVDTVGSGEECLEFLASDEYPLPDVIALDLMLPKQDGFEILTDIRNNPAYTGVDILVISGLGQGDSKAKAFELGASDYVTKPIIIDELVMRINQLA